MSTRKKITVAAGAVVIILAIAAYFYFPTSPLSSLNAADIEEIHVFAAPPEQQVVLSQEQMAQAVELLQEVTVRQRGYKANFTVGQVVKFTVIKKDGTGIEVVNSANTSITVNGISYRAEYASAERLNSFANSVMK